MLIILELAMKRLITFLKANKSTKTLHMSRETSLYKKKGTNAKQGKTNATNIEKRTSKQAQIKKNRNSLSSLINTDLLIPGNLTLFSKNYF